MNAVGIDVSKGKSMVAALRPMGEVALMPQEFLHTGVGLEQMAYAIIALGEDTRIVMEATGRCHISLTDKTFPDVNELFTSPERAEMTRLAMQLPEYDTVRAMYGVGETTAVQLMAEIGDVHRFPRRSSVVGFAGVDPAVNQSGKHSAKSVPTAKRSSPYLRKTLYQIVCTYLKKSPADEPVYQFLDKKHGEGKPYFVYMTAAQNKFLRIYYARVKECLEAFDARQSLTQS